MGRTLRAGVIGALLLLPAQGHASMSVTAGLTVTNACHKDIAFAVRYKAAGGWETTPFTTIPAGKQKNRVVSSDNSVFYYYAESTSGGQTTRWAGDKNRVVEGKTYPMREKTLDFEEQGNRYHLRLTCKNG